MNLFFTSVAFVFLSLEAESVVMDLGAIYKRSYKEDISSYTFYVDAEVKNSVEVHFNQISCLLRLEVMNPEGRVIRRMASTNSTAGPLILDFTTDIAGRYKIVAIQNHKFYPKYNTFEAKLVSKLSKEEQEQQETKILQSDIISQFKRYASKVKSIDYHDVDYTDLTPLKNAIGDARVVMLGEQTHMDGATFDAKARLIRFLRKEMGFNVLVFESGLYEVYRLQQDLHNQNPCVRWSDSIFSTWTNVEQFTPIIEMYHSPDPGLQHMELWGIDIQLSKRYANEFSSKLKELVLATAGKIHADDELFSKILQNVISFKYYAKKIERPKPNEITLFYNVLTYYLKYLQKYNSDNLTSPLQLEVEVYQQALRSIKANSYEHLHEGVSLREANEIRDRQMGENFLWLAEKVYPNEKFILWAATSHILRNTKNLSHFHTEEDLNILKMGDVIFEVMGDDIYSIAFTALKGQFGNERRKKASTPEQWLNYQIHPNMVPELELEEMFNYTGYEYGFLDLKNSPPPWLKNEQISRPTGYQPLKGKWPEVIDGLFYIQKMNIVISSEDR